MNAHVAIVAGAGGAVSTPKRPTPMQRQGSGAIVHVAARPGIDPAGGMAAYSVSKAALVQLTRILDVELRLHGIRVVTPRITTIR
jgi:NAD(P)-dependent dehydrogenase (short-subunit alcohol dehydrogenase family)